MAVTAWVARHTGLPSFRVTAGETVTTSNGRVLTRGLREDVFSDALAQPGAATSYDAGTRTITLTRSGYEWWAAVLTTPDGRPVPGIVWEKDGDPIDYSPDVSIFSPTAHRWPMTTPMRTGSGTLTLLDPDQEPSLWDLLQHKGPLILAPGQPTAALPMRTIVLTSVSRKRISGDGATRFNASWSEIPLTHPSLNTGRTGVITWGEWDSLDRGWAHRTYLDLCQRLAGMPA